MQALVLAVANAGSPVGIVVNQPDAEGTNVQAWGLCGNVVGEAAEYGAYIVVGSATQLDAVAALDTVLICDTLGWHDVMLPASLAALNQLLTALEIELPEGTTYQQAMTALFPDFAPANYSVSDSEEQQE